MIATPSALFALLAVGALGQADLEQQASDHVRREFERVGRQAPAVDPALTEAARALAAEALRTGARQAADLQAISAVVSAAGGSDPAPRAVVIRATPSELALQSFLSRRDLNEEPASHVGVGAALSKGDAVLVALIADRKVALRPFPRSFPKTDASANLCGELRGGLSQVEVYVTLPSGAVDKDPARTVGTSFCARISFPLQGRHSVEAIARGPNGPEVISLFYVDVQTPFNQARVAQVIEPTTVPEARAAIAARINALRKAQGAAAVAPAEILDAVAQTYADRMVRDRFFAHVSPDGDDLKARLSRAQYGYVHAGENLGLASGPLAAHFAIEHSPGHRKNLLTPDYTALGIGVAWDTSDGRGSALVVEVLALPPSSISVANPLEATYRALDRYRADDKLPPLKRSSTLEKIAIAHVQRALQLNSPKAQIPGSSIYDKVFDALGSVKTATVDVYVADDPGAIPRTKSVQDAKNDFVGVGAVKGDSPTFGKEKYWVVVIYAASR